MDWQKLLRLHQGQEVDYNPEELKNEAKPIFEVSEVIRPRFLVSLNFPSGLNIVFCISYHKGKDAFQARMRLRSSDGQKQVLPASQWKTFKDEKAFEKNKQGVIRAFEELAKKTDEDRPEMTKLEFGPQASIQEIAEAFISSKVFDVVTFDPKNRKAKKLA
jgi:hypothetical protein